MRLFCEPLTNHNLIVMISNLIQNRGVQMLSVRTDSRCIAKRLRLLASICVWFGVSQLLFAAVQGAQITRFNDISSDDEPDLLGGGNVAYKNEEGDWFIPKDHSVYLRQCVQCSPEGNVTVYRNGVKIIGTHEFERLEMPDVGVTTDLSLPIVELPRQPVRTDLTSGRFLVDKWGGFGIEAFNEGFNGGYHCVCRLPHQRQPRVGRAHVLRAAWWNTSFGEAAPAINILASQVWLTCPRVRGWFPPPKLFWERSGDGILGEGANFKVTQPGTYFCVAVNPSGAMQSLGLVIGDFLQRTAVQTGAPGNSMLTHKSVRRTCITGNIQDALWAVISIVAALMIAAVLMTWIYWGLRQNVAGSTGGRSDAGTSGSWACLKCCRKDAISPIGSLRLPNPGVDVEGGHMQRNQVVRY